MTAPLGRIIIYTKKMPEMVAFYCKHFGFNAVKKEGDRIVELQPAGGGATIMLHAASKSQKDGQSLVKLVFDVEDVIVFCSKAAQTGLQFGAIHKANGYVYSNTKDPSNNPVSVSSRAFAG